ncbi:hypothetical protein PRIPAC_96197 [Pristionchus pacificus]|uniref:Histone-lysine N-methyltransferase, H3 lysine-79 specific n=1 Tax=Pristionchus pacificus TaxID=54126 RepID=A0A2A6D154_PRIPA|nr:hypothetical protein PRIPAC_96197 [Pristionchus pacificus]|eukprot:PDM84013.1 hypothetical protein PRIPAC_34205 [Pristionchus pacificus]
MSLTITVDTSCEAIVDHRIENGMLEYHVKKTSGKRRWISQYCARSCSHLILPYWLALPSSKYNGVRPPLIARHFLRIANKENVANVKQVVIKATSVNRTRLINCESLHLKDLPSCPVLTEDEKRGICCRDTYMTIDVDTASHKDKVLHCLEIAYASAVPNPKMLNSNKPGDLTYGEINEHQLRAFLLHPKITPTAADFFMDIGMGVGRATGVVSLWFPDMQGVAGIEIDPKFEEPMATFKTGLETKAKELGLGFAPLHGIIGDFTTWGKAKDVSNTFVRIMEKTTILFAHNTAFSSETNEKLEELVFQMGHGCRIITAQMLGKGKGVKRGQRQFMKTKLVFSYGEADFNSANYNILSRLDVEPLEMLENGVSYSWQQKQFFLHVVNLKKEERLKEATKMKGSRVNWEDLLKAEKGQENR